MTITKDSVVANQSGSLSLVRVGRDSTVRAQVTTATGRVICSKEILLVAIAASNGLFRLVARTDHPMAKNSVWYLVKNTVLEAS